MARRPWRLRGRPLPGAGLHAGQGLPVGLGLGRLAPGPRRRVPDLRHGRHRRGLPHDRRATAG
jgi:hypothetical protein